MPPIAAEPASHDDRPRWPSRAAPTETVGHESRASSAAGSTTGCGVSKFADSVLNHVFPDHWSFMLGEIAMYCFVILVADRRLPHVLLPSRQPRRRVPGQLRAAARRADVGGVRVDDRAQLRRARRAGRAPDPPLGRADVFAAAIVVHLCRIFFTGAFRRPREINWIIGVTMLILAIVNGFAGYSLPDDLLSGTGLRIALLDRCCRSRSSGRGSRRCSSAARIPAPAIIGRLFIIHVLILPALIAVLLGAHLAIVWRQKHTQFPGPGATEHNVVGSRLWPTYAAKSVGPVRRRRRGRRRARRPRADQPDLAVRAVPTPARSRTAAQPDWYMGWLEGALRICSRLASSTCSATRSPSCSGPASCCPGSPSRCLRVAVPRSARHRATAPTTSCSTVPATGPVRTAIGVGVLTFYIVLFVAGSQDIFAQHLDAPIATVDRTFRVLLFVAPIVVAAIAWKWCHDLTARPPDDPDDSDEPESPPEPELEPQPELEAAQGAHLTD